MSSDIMIVNEGKMGQEGVHIDERFKLSICPLPLMIRELNVS